MQAIRDWQMSGWQEFSFSAPTTGAYHLELSLIADAAGMLDFQLDSSQMEARLVECGNYPVTLRMENLVLREGVHRLMASSKAIRFGVYLWRLQPVWKTLGPAFWRTIGAFPTSFEARGSDARVKESLARRFPPELRMERDTRYEGVGGARVAWNLKVINEESVNLGRLCKSDLPGICYARTVVVSPERRAFDLLLGCDWWANLYVNGALVQSERDAAGFQSDGAWFNGWKPVPARVQLEPGENVFLVKCHPGSADNWIAFFANNAGDLVFIP